jgi:FkbM family methyltransferase
MYNSISIYVGSNVLFSFVYDGKDFTVDLSEDFYGQNFWERVSKSEYEPDTLDFLHRNCDQETTFMDVGAANGAMTLVAASLGAEVFSYEPDPLMNRVLTRNVELNPKINKKIRINNCALSAKKGETEFSKGSNSKVLSSIVFSGNRDERDTKIKINAISDELNALKRSGSQIVIKMDIEGAEWGILRDPVTVQSLHKHSVIMLLAVHPGFYRPHKKIFPGVTRVSFEIWRIRNFIESYKLFTGLSKVATIKRTNLNPVISAKMFAALCLAGYLEFIIEFNSN